MQLVIEKDGAILHGPARWDILAVHVGLRGNACPPLPYETEHGTVREYRVVKPNPGLTETHGEPTEGVEGGAWVQAFPVVQRPIEERRAAAEMTRTDFALLATAQGWVAEAEALAWVGGAAIPGWVEQIIDANIPAENRLLVKAQTLSDPTVRRTGTLMPMLQEAMGVTDEELDALFGIT